MHNSYDHLVQLLCEVPAYVVEDRLNKNIIAELARKYDVGLINKLLSDEDAKKLFFCKSDAGLIFKKDIFLQFISQKEFLPDSYTAFEQKIGLASGGMMLRNDDHVVLNWPYKDCILEGGQTKEDAKRDEVFFNEVLAPDEINTILEDKVFTDWRRYDKDGEHELDELKPNDNLIIKGNNLVVLYSLKKRFAGRINLIYIDPPFYFSSNKDDSFKYNSNFKLSTWLTFMRNRLTVAKDLLSNDGIIMVHVGVEDQAYINILLDEIFGHDKMVSHVTMTTNDPSGFKATGSKIFSTANNLFIYKKSIGEVKKTYVPRDYDKEYKYVLLNNDDDYTKWRYTTIKQYLIDQGNTKPVEKDIEQFALSHPDVVFRTAAIGGGARKKRLATIEKSAKNKGVVMQHPGEDIEDFYILNGEGIVFYKNNFHVIDGKEQPAHLATDVWTDISWTGIANEGDVILKNGKKPEKLLARVIEMATKPGDIVLDYHLGSGTTAAVAHKMGRQYIGIEQLFYDKNDSIKRLQTVINGDQSGISKNIGWIGGGSFVCCNIKDDANEFRKRVQAAGDKKMDDLLDEVLHSSFLSYRIDAKNHHIRIGDFHKLSLVDKKHVLLDLIDNNALYLNYSEIDDAIYKISDEDKRHNKTFYGE